MSSPESWPSSTAVDTLKALRLRKNVLISGPPGTGKTRLLNEIARNFEEIQPANLRHDPLGENPFPQGDQQQWLLSPERSNRLVIRTTFHPGTRYRHLLRGLEPDPSMPSRFRYSSGLLFQANKHACLSDGAALLIIDELNRGPAVEVFGDAIVAIEADKRLDADGELSDSSYPVYLPNDDGVLSAVYFSSHLYILAAMNEADASVAPVDTAFRRRWEQLQLLPDVDLAHRVLGLSGDSATDSPTLALLKAFVDIWEIVNERIALLRGIDFQLGHAVTIPEPGRELSGTFAAVEFVNERWQQLERHVAEVFFGNPRAEVAALAGNDESAYTIVEDAVGAEQGLRIHRKQKPTTAQEWTELFKALASGS